MTNTRENILSTLYASYIDKNVPARMQSELYNAHYDPEWDFLEKSDGSTYANFDWVNDYHPIFVWHDWKMQNLKRFVGDRKDYKNIFQYWKAKFEYVRDVNLYLKNMMEVYKPIPIEYVSDLESYYKKTFIKATISKFLFGR